MTLHPEAKWTARDRNRKQRRSRKQADHQLTAIVAALGAGETEDWPQDEQPKRRKKESGHE